MLAGCGGAGTTPSASAFCRYARSTGAVFARIERNSPVGGVPGKLIESRFAHLQDLSPNAIRGDMKAIAHRVQSVVSGLSNTPDFGKAAADEASKRLTAWTARHCGEGMRTLLSGSSPG